MASDEVSLSRRQYLAPVTTAVAAALVDYFPETEPELGGVTQVGSACSPLAAGQRTCGGTGLEAWSQMGPANPYVGISWSRSLLQGTVQGMVSGPVFGHLSPNCASHPSLAATWFLVSIPNKMLPCPQILKPFSPV